MGKIKDFLGDFFEALGDFFEDISDSIKEETSIKGKIVAFHNSIFGNIKMKVKLSIAFSMILLAMVGVGHIAINYFANIAEVYQNVEQESVPYIASDENTKEDEEIKNKKQELEKNMKKCDTMIEDGTLKVRSMVIIIFSLAVIVIVITILDVTHNIRKIVMYASAMNDGDLKYRIKNLRYDEFGLLGRSLNTATKSMQDVVKNIDIASEELSQVVKDCEKDFNAVKDYIDETSKVSDRLKNDMKITLDNTEHMQEVAGDIKTATEVVATKATDGINVAKSIEAKATGMSKQVLDAQNESLKVLEQIKKSLQDSIDKAKSVEKIKSLADTILSIAHQTNLIALNSAIEAARAGEAGRGFKVVSDEIRNLAIKSKESVEEIKVVTEVVYVSVEGLMEQSNRVLSFVENDIIKDYSDMYELTKSYDDDAIAISDMTSELSAISEQLSATLAGLVTFIDSIADLSKAGVESVEVVDEKVINIRDRSGSILKTIENVGVTSDELVEKINKFDV